MIIIGSGLAGLYAAVCSDPGRKIAIITKSAFQTSNTFWAQGGIAAVTSIDDKPAYHFRDTIIAGRGLCDEKVVDLLVNEGPKRIQHLINLGMNFDIEDGAIALGLEGGHSKRRVLHAGGDATGKELVNFLIMKIKEMHNIHVYEYSDVTELICENDYCYGAEIYKFIPGEIEILFSSVVLLATGGASGIFDRTTNPETATGDGISLAYNAGAEIADMEFIQFHPTALYTKSGRTMLISEAVRGEGAYLIDSDGKRFMFDYHPDGELAPRDIVTRSIVRHLLKSGEKKVFLKLDHLNKKKILARFSNINDSLREFGLNLFENPIPVSPAAHYMIGGVLTGLSGETSVRNLFAAGETTSSGVHGANRLASNSLLECVVFAKRAADFSSGYTFPERAVREYRKGKDFNFDPSVSGILRKFRTEIGKIMTDYSGIIRNEGSILQARNLINSFSNEFISKPAEYHGRKMSGIASVALLITEFALARRESRGGHIREDFPDEKDEFSYRVKRSINSELTRVNN